MVFSNKQMKRSAVFLTVCLSGLSRLSLGFVPVERRTITFFPSPSTCSSLCATFEDIEGLGYTIEVEKPLGVIFSENSAPYLGLEVNDVEFGLNGAKAGIRVGQQLLAVNRKVVVGGEFDSIMDNMINSPNPMELTLFEGSVKELYFAISDDVDLGDEDANDDEEVVMDENYETPVVIDVEPGDEDLPDYDLGLAIKGLGVLGSRAMEMAKDTVKESLAKKEEEGGEKKKSGGFFGSIFNQKTIQLEDGDGK